jgi:hypothetical protein
MKKLITLLALVITLITNAQAPQGFNYQATVRNSSGALIVNQIVLVKFNVYQNAATGTLVYSENQTANTDDLGHINLVVGQGTVTTGTFSTINWGTGSYYLGIELNTGSGYVTMGTTQLLSVPYAFFANRAQNLLSQKLTDLDDAHSGGTDFNNSIQIGNVGPYTYTQASGNTGVGINVFNSLTTGFNNSTFGYQSFKNNTIGNNNVSMGYKALFENDEGSYNVAIGAHALEKNKVSQAGSLGGAGFQNVAIGSWALNNAISHMNVAVGTEALRSLTVGGQNTAMGEHALRDLTTGFGNIAIGYSSMILSSPSASSNTALGTKSGEQNQGSNNIFIGEGAGQFNNGSGNVLIGKNSGWDNVFHNQNNILIIENSASTSPLIHGNFQDKKLTINNTLTVTSNIGVGVSSPQRSLHVNDVIRLEPRATEPSNPSKGDIYMDNNTNKLRVFDGTQWQNCW